LTVEAGQRRTWGASTADRLLRWWGRALNQLPNAAGCDAIRAAMENTSAAQVWTAGLWDELVGILHGSDVSLPLDEQIAAMKAFYFGGERSVASQINAKLHETAEVIARAVDGVTATDLIALSLDIEVVSGVFYWGADEYDTPLFHYANLTPAQKPIIDLGCVGTMKDWPNRKLYGERWGHFGAFSGPKRRDHDWLWGRIDGASQISEQLLSRAPADVDVDGLRDELLVAILASEGTNEREVVLGAETAYGMTDARMVLDLLDGPAPSGKTAVKNLLQTLVLMRQPKGFWMRTATVCVMPLNPRRITAAWPAIHRFSARVAWVVTYLPRQCFLSWGYRHLRKRFKE
jgi:hypothetical protein